MLCSLFCIKSLLSIFFLLRDIVKVYLLAVFFCSSLFCLIKSKIYTYSCMRYYIELSDGNGLDRSLVQDLMNLMDECNLLVKSFRMVCDFREANVDVPVKLRSFRNRSSDSRVYNVPEISEVAALIVGDFDSSEDSRDIVVRDRDGGLRRIHETHSKYIPLQYPILFPLGEDQYEENIELNRRTTTGSVKKHVRVSLREFVAYRLQERDNENSVIFQ